jgi:hypothetical protein
VIGLVFGAAILKPVLIVLAVLTHVTVFQRVLQARKASREYRGQ